LSVSLFAAQSQIFTLLGSFDTAFAKIALHYSGVARRAASSQISSFSGQCSNAYAKIFLAA